MSASYFKVKYLGEGVAYETGMSAMRLAMSQVKTEGPVLLLLEHEDVITTTRQHKMTHLLTSKELLAEDGIRLLETDRGGDITFHGKGQLVGYPVLQLPPCKGPMDYVRVLQKALGEVCLELGVKNIVCVPDKTGIWVQAQSSKELKKIIAIGVGLSKGVTRHGFAFNLTTDLERFTKHIVPCGLKGFGVTSLEKELKKPVPPVSVIAELIVLKLTQTIKANLRSE